MYFLFLAEEKKTILSVEKNDEDASFLRRSPPNKSTLQVSEFIELA